MRNDTALVACRGLHRIFHRGGLTVHALNDVDIECRSGTFTVLRGPSGSGKTTLLNMLGTLDAPDRGTVYLDGIDVRSLHERGREAFRRKNIGFIFQSVALVSSMSAYENVDFVLRVAKLRPKERRERTEECLAMVGLANRMHHRPAELSGGEQQRVAIARAVAHNPRIILADEPTAELDTQTGLQVVRIFRSLVQEQGMTVIMTTHDPDLMGLADAVVSLRDGALE